MPKKYIVTIRNKGLFGGTTTINVTDAAEKNAFTKYEDGCFKLYGIKEGKTCNYVFPLDKIEIIEIKEVEE